MILWVADSMKMYVEVSLHTTTDNTILRVQTTMRIVLLYNVYEISYR